MKVNGILWVLWLGFVLLLAGIVGLFACIIYNPGNLFGPMPGLDKLGNPKSELASEIFSADGVSLGKYYRENRAPVTYDQISPYMLQALYATEDIRFEQHSGIDLKGTLAITMYLLQGKRRGSSTITQQLAKNLFQTRGEDYDGTLTSVPGLRTAIIKFKEWVVAINLERTYTKREIVELYLNTVSFGSNAFGIKTAAYTFFATTTQDLKIEEAAMLVGLLKAPSMYSPIYRPKRALERRNTVLDQMERYGFISSQVADSLKAEPIAIKYRLEDHNEGKATYFRAEIRKELLAFCRENGYDLYADGLKIYTTLDSRLQQYAEQAVARHLTDHQAKFFEHWAGRNPWVDENGKELKGFIETAAKRSQVYKQFLQEYEGNQDSAWALMHRKVPMRVFSWKGDIDTLFSPIDSIRYYKHYLRAGLMSMDAGTGQVKAWVGGINFKYFKYDHVRQGKRQPGSTFKPFLYAAALDNGFTPCTEMVDAPVTFYEGTPKAWTPKNADGVYTGERYSLRTALAFSVNSVAAGLLKKLTLNDDYSLIINISKALGINSTIDPVPALVLGTSDVSLYEMVGAYATFANKGVYTKPQFITRIEDKHGNVLKSYIPERREAITEELAYNMLYMLTGASTIRNGTAMGLYKYGNTLRGGNEVAAKTGTTSNYSDGWFVGVTNPLVTGVWVGGEDRSIHFRSFALGQGSRMAMPIWAYYMESVYTHPNSSLARLGYKKQRFAWPTYYKKIVECKLNVADSTQADSLLIKNAPDREALKDEF